MVPFVPCHVSAVSMATSTFILKHSMVCQKAVLQSGHIMIVTRCNKIAIQATAHMAADKEADCHPSNSSYGCGQGSRWLIESPHLGMCLYVSILFVNISILLECTQSADNVFPSVGLLGKITLPNIQSTLSFH